MSSLGIWLLSVSSKRNKIDQGCIFSGARALRASGMHLKRVRWNHRHCLDLTRAWIFNRGFGTPSGSPKLEQQGPTNLFVIVTFYIFTLNATPTLASLFWGGNLPKVADLQACGLIYMGCFCRRARV